MMSRSFTSREKALMLVLAVILLFVAYYRMVHLPVQERIAAAHLQQDAINMEILVEATRLSIMQRMQGELDEIRGVSGGQVVEIMPYDNIQLVMQELNSILDKATAFTLNFAPVTEPQDNLVRRVIHMSFSCASYGDAKTILTKLHDCRYRCQIGDLSVLSADREGSINDGAVSVSLTVTFFEFVR